jgi:RimJ/RimL family protein N-acetyltransferase
VTNHAPDRIQTRRMIGERLRLDHEPDLAALLLDPCVSPTLWPAGPPPTEEDVRRSLVDKIDHWERHGFGMWLFQDRETGAALARGGLQQSLIGGTWEVEVGWAVVPGHWRQGLATELALASTDIAFNDLDLREIVAFALPTNAASRRVMEKVGFAYERDFEQAGLPHMLYRLRRC